MKKLLLPLLLVVLLAMANTVFAQANECAKFKTGRFKMSYSGKTAIITRTATLQTEEIDQTRTYATYNVLWTSNCSYTLTPTPATLSQFPNMAEDLVITVQIVKVTDKVCTIVILSNLYSKVLKGEMLKIN